MAVKGTPTRETSTPTRQFFGAYAVLVIAGLLAEYQWRSRGVAVVLAVFLVASFVVWRESRDAPSVAERTQRESELVLLLVAASAFVVGAVWLNDGNRVYDSFVGGNYPVEERGIAGVIPTVATFVALGVAEGLRRLRRRNRGKTLMDALTSLTAVDETRRATEPDARD